MCHPHVGTPHIFWL